MDNFLRQDFKTLSEKLGTPRGLVKGDLMIIVKIGFI